MMMVGQPPAFNSVYFQGAEPTEELAVATLWYNLTLASAADDSSFVANDGISWVALLNTGVVDTGM